jgi:putative phosphoribosyl transferase
LQSSHVDQYIDPTHAGHELALDLRRFLGGQRAFVLAVPPDGVPVAASIARELDAPMDLAVSRRMVTGDHPDETLGAVTPDRTLVVNKPLVSRIGLTDEEVERLSIPEWAEAQRAMQRYRRGRPYPTLQGYTAIVVDDGLTTGYTMLGAIISVRKLEPDRVIVAVPVSSLEAIERLRDYADDLLALKISSAENFSVEQYYRRYAHPTDQEVIWTLDDLWADKPPTGFNETF